MIQSELIPSKATIDTENDLTNLEKIDFSGRHSADLKSFKLAATSSIVNDDGILTSFPAAVPSVFSSCEETMQLQRSV